MTFSVDMDFWPFQAGSLQDATARADSGNGRGKDFASSLVGVSADTASSVDQPLAARDAVPLASLNLFHGLPTPAPETQDQLASMPVEDMAALSVQAGLVVPINQEAPTPKQGTGTEPAPEADAIAAEDAPQPADSGLIVTLRPVAEAPPADNVVQTAAPNAAAVGETHSQAPILPENAVTPMSAPVTLGATSIPESVPVADKPRIEAASALAGTPPMTAKTPAASLPEHAPPARRSATASPDARFPDSLPADMLADLSDQPSPAIGAAGSEPGQTGNSGADTTANPSIPGAALGGAAPPGQPSPQPTGNPATAQLTPAHAMLTATATQLPEIVARATSDGQDDRIMVQLDPPELGRVSIDFKFDAQGLQHVTITAESPEAMRQLRLMHFELVQALERNGLTGQNMSFQHQAPQQNEGWGENAKLAGTRFDTPALTGTGLMIAADSNPNRQIASSGRLDIRL
ncbi:MAG: hypothetical protein CVT79_03375 [Alphaproteobacteria bacterium HGW-Alphaproteobacteria-18]|nr:MAG: hypothetical protein CVT79_03375 [Alphaproteobacteria bacterium HGW-Alphaproteobacteria-18]